jgi:hypothetical protein
MSARQQLVERRFANLFSQRLQALDRFCGLGPSKFRLWQEARNCFSITGDADHAAALDLVQQLVKSSLRVGIVLFENVRHCDSPVGSNVAFAARLRQSWAPARSCHVESTR